VRIIFSGMLAGVPHNGGATWAVLQYLLGFRRLGHDVLFVEPVDALTPENVSYFEAVVSAYGLEGNASLLESGGSDSAGVPYSRLREWARAADLLVNVSGMLRHEELREPILSRVYLDLDPVFNQLWHSEGVDVGFAGHTQFVTVGQAIGRPGCHVPTDGLRWIPTLPPVVLGEWTPSERIELDALTTVANWRSYGSIRRDGVLYGQKAHAFRELIELPTRTNEAILLGLAIDADEHRDLEALERHRWRLRDPRAVAGTPERYWRFVRGSKAELGIAKAGYVTARSGWFSDRSACYLASGRPVLAHETGFSEFLPTGEGLFAFSTVDEALAAIDELSTDYKRHARAARRIAEEYFDSDRVLPQLLEAVTAGP